MNKLEILQVVPSFKPSWGTGGAARVAYEISKKLAERGQNVTVYTTDGLLSRLEVDKNKPLNVDGTKTYYFRNLSTFLIRKINLPIPYYLPLVARREIKGFDVLHLHGYRTVLTAVVSYYAKKYGIPYILQAHGSVETYFQKGTLKRLFDKFWGYRILKDATKLIAVAPTEAEQYKSMGVSEDKIEIVPNGIDLSEFDNLPPRGEFRKKYGLDDSQKIILYLGRIHQTKGIDLLARAFADLTKELDRAKLVIVGPDDGYLPALKKLIKELKIEEKVIFTGPLYEEEKLKTYIDADVFVNPRADEIFGLVFLEALACGTPVICSRRCGIADVIDGQAGLAVPYDKGRLSNAILRMLSDDKMRQQFREKGKLLVRERYNWGKIVEQVEGLYRAVAK
jgi:glycosyltransferase involved in cell wall biosynthesis